MAGLVTRGESNALSERLHSTRESKGRTPLMAGLL